MLQKPGYAPAAMSQSWPKGFTFDKVPLKKQRHGVFFGGSNLPLGLGV